MVPTGAEYGVETTRNFADMDMQDPNHSIGSFAFYQVNLFGLSAKTSLTVSMPFIQLDATRTEPFIQLDTTGTETARDCSSCPAASGPMRSSYDWHETHYSGRTL